ncbi:Dabb family protein [Parafilimonas sp.]|uniref:Dabb family protein n=1 Tax=Parafilimonas sp. TaxID=1969739 RepID=UPI0039E3AAA8
MKKIILPALCTVLLSTVSMAQSPAKILRHVVLFGWKEGADSAAIDNAVKAFAALPGKINLIKAFEWGINNSPEKLNQGLTHCFMLGFSSEEDRDAYLVHPDHVAFAKILSPVLAKVTVVDYWAQ